MKKVYDIFIHNRVLTVSMCVVGAAFVLTNIIHFVQCWTKQSWWLDIYNLSNAITINILAAYFFYIIVVYVPENKKRFIIKNNLHRQYLGFKESLIQRFLNITEETDNDLATKLLDIKEFREHFNADRSKRWYMVLNALDGNPNELKEILSELAILRNEISFVLNNVQIHDEKAFTFFKNLSETIYKLEQSNFETDDFKGLMSFMWRLFSGWSWTDGYAETDIVQSIIDKI